MNSSIETFSQWINAATNIQKSASANKQAADREALYGIKDPNCQGEVTIPSHPDGNNRAMHVLPPNTNNFGTPNPDAHIYSVTDPAGVGQGSYITPRSGNAREDAATSPTVALDKIANSAQSVLNSMYGNFAMPQNLNQEPQLMDKLASIGAMMLGTTEGQRAVAETMEREAGIKEASAIIGYVADSMEKEAAAAAQLQAGYTQYQSEDQFMNKVASDYQAHMAWLSQFSSELEKQAYEQGAVDAEAAEAAAAEGGEPELPSALEDDAVLAELKALVDSGEIAPEEAEAVLQALAGDGQPGGELETIAAELQAAVQSGDISPEDADAVAGALMDAAGVGAEAGVAPEEAAAAEGVQKTASVIGELFGW